MYPTLQKESEQCVLKYTQERAKCPPLKQANFRAGPLIFYKLRETTVILQSKSQNFDSLSPRRNSERKGLKIAWLLSRLFQELLNHLLLCCKFPNKGSTVSATFYLIISGKAVISEAPHKVVPKSSGGDYDGVGGF